MNLLGWLAKILRYVPAQEREGIRLAPGRYWAVWPPTDFALFLRALEHLVPDGSVLYLEGGSPTEEIRSYLEARSANATTKVALGTIWPRPTQFHMRIDAESLRGLAALAEDRLLPEIAVHIHVYAHGRVLLEWYDAPDDPIRISSEIPEDKVEEFCARLGTRYEREERRA